LPGRITVAAFERDLSHGACRALLDLHSTGKQSILWNLMRLEPRALNTRVDLPHVPAKQH
jgi:hypothetical protein